MRKNLISHGRFLLLATLATLVTLAAGSGCTSKDNSPIQLGFVGSLTGRTADLGIDGRNGLQLAIEQTNAAGGINGRPLNLIIKDDEASADRGKAVVGELIAAKVAAIFGPMTSNVAVATAPLATSANTLMIAGTVTTNALSGIDDQFFRVIASTTAHSATMAQYLFKQKNVRHTAVLVNLANRSYTESWANDYTTATGTLTGAKVTRIDYTSAEGISFEPFAKQLVASNPDAIILVTNAVDAAQVANQLVRLGSKAIHATSEWAGSGKLMDLGGANVEGFIVPQYIDLASTAPAFLKFREDYQKRFKQEPGFPALEIFDAATVVIHALREQQKEESLKQTLLRLKSFATVQERIVFDAFGDVHSPTFLTEIRDGRYQPVR